MPLSDRYRTHTFVPANRAIADTERSPEKDGDRPIGTSPADPVRTPRVSRARRAQLEGAS